MRTLTKVAVAVMTCSLAAPSCKKIEDLNKITVDDVVKSASQVAVREASKRGMMLPTTEKDSPLLAKLATYARCYNTVSHRIVSSRRRYLSWVNEKTGPTGKERPILGLYDIFLDGCFRGLDGVKALDRPLPDLDETVATYREVVGEMASVMNAAAKYYDQEDYKDDAMAKGKAFHARLANLFPRFQVVHDEFATRFTVHAQSLLADRLRLLSSDPARRVAFLTQTLFASAARLVAFADVSAPKDVDEKGLSEAVRVTGADLDALDAYTQVHPPEPRDVVDVRLAISKSQAFLKAAKTFLRNHRDHKDWTREAPSLFDDAQAGHPANVIHEYNALIDASGGLFWLTPSLVVLGRHAYGAPRTSTKH